MTQREEFEEAWAAQGWWHRFERNPGGGEYYDAEVLTGWIMWQASAARYEPLVEAARNLRGWGVELDDSRLDYIDVQLYRSDVEAFDAALAALGDGK